MSRPLTCVVSLPTRIASGRVFECSPLRSVCEGLLRETAIATAMDGGARWSLLFAMLMLLYAIAFYKPLPPDFTDNAIDRMVAGSAEVFLRFSYIYPTAAFCGDVYCELRWTRRVLDTSLWLISFIRAGDSELLVETVYFDSVRVRVYRPLVDNSYLPAIVFLHGGGYVMGSIEGFDSIARRLATAVHAVVISVDYRLAPEHIFPAAVDDAESALVYLLTKAYASFGVDRSRVALMGDSAGGGLVAAVTYRLRERNDIPQLKAQVLIYPLLQMGNLRTPSYEYYRRALVGRVFVEPRAIVLYYMMYAGLNLLHDSQLIDVALDNAHISPLDRTTIDEYVDIDRLPHDFKTNSSFSTRHYNEEASRLMVPFVFNPEFAPLMQPNLTSLPRALVVTCQHDILRDEGVLYASRLAEAGVPTTWKHLETGFHALLNFHSTMLTASRAFDYVSQWLLDNI
uniref:Arylacetamide deacetylase n=2 Tax=Ascaris TaxID=6251 RepID=A0A0M3IAQ3_ASCLU